MSPVNRAEIHSCPFVAFSHIPQLDQLLQQIPVYQESEREEKMRVSASSPNKLHI